MKIIAGICEVPGLNIPGGKQTYDDGLKYVRYSFSEKMSTPQWAVSVCKKLLEKNNISADQIGVIVGTSLSLTGTTDETNSAAPGVCHSVQKALSASNAFVFDLFHTDWNTALEIGNAFLKQQSCKYGLVVKAENFYNFEFDKEKGFALSDAASAILFEVDTDCPAVNHFQLDDPIKEARLSIVPNTDIENTEMKFKINWNYQPEDITLLSTRLASIKSEADSGTGITLAEDWFDRAGHDDLFLGMHSFPWHLQQVGSSDASRPGQTLHAILFNPFLVEFTSLQYTI